MHFIKGWQTGSRTILVILVLAIITVWAAIPFADENDSRLWHASFEGDLAKVKQLLDMGAGVDYIASGGINTLMIALVQKHPDVAQLLLSRDVDVNYKTPNNGFTSLMCAAQNGYTEVVQLLLSKGADVNANDKRGRTALAFAKSNGHKRLAEDLKRAGGVEVSHNDATTMIVSDKEIKCNNQTIRIGMTKNEISQKIKLMGRQVTKQSSNRWVLRPIVLIFRDEKLSEIGKHIVF